MMVICSCWISAADPKVGALWAFAAPMLAIIIVSVGDKPPDIMQKSAFPA